MVGSRALPPQVQRAKAAEEKELPVELLEAREELARARQEEREFQSELLKKDEEERQDRLSRLTGREAKQLSAQTQLAREQKASERALAAGSRAQAEAAAREARAAAMERYRTTLDGERHAKWVHVALARSAHADAHICEVGSTPRETSS